MSAGSVLAGQQQSREQVDQRCHDSADRRACSNIHHGALFAAVVLIRMPPRSPTAGRAGRPRGR